MVALTLLAGAHPVTAGGPAKVQVCHIPPGNAANFHTITVSEKALGAHLEHGDIAGGCFDHCETLCDDGDACTVDECEPGTETCVSNPQAVSCDDGRFCTTDRCEPSSGCVYAQVTCQAPDLCTISACSEADQGTCIEVAKSCPPGDECSPIDGFCSDPCAGVVCEPSSTTECAGTQVHVCIGGSCIGSGPCEQEYGEGESGGGESEEPPVGEEQP